MESSSRLLASKEIFKIILFVLCIYGATDYSQPKEWVKFIDKLAGRSHIYITQISLYMTIMTLSLSYCVKHFGASRIKEVYRDFLSITLPLEGLVTTVFWTLNAIDPTLLKNKDLYMAGVRTPLISEMSIHLFPFILLLIDQVGVNIYGARRHYWTFAIFGFVYFMVIHYFQRLNNSWVYPFLGYMSISMRMALVAAATLLVFAYYKLFLQISRIINAKIHSSTAKDKLL
ncbi:uncharacterized protein Eint_030940 [Encephalitozoon intestinalis ATCC 50506]|uniref:FAR-17a/AIG1-like protein n=1 Tax=Encephalitozoon intestinalis (strain ATCC 50506) TaxID=876142 RepID=E0S6A3_ENCIT|nr:uncharacterized protein Eint_030940 [Encephalitozoon intestinalis ATCC 50506]ADM11238.1 hypothetical protein Eint_030940 [Encephalitozoon intestinalis ATCC 50506]UTX44906.1 FAR-17a/AIG1-like protein [Encephalitozoon intestinalis]